MIGIARWAVLLAAMVGCDRGRARNTLPAASRADSMGVGPTHVHVVPLRGHRDLHENSGAAMSVAQPGIWFTINDSGNEPVLFAFDTTGSPRGSWRINGAQNVDWESVSYGPCDDLNAARCVYIGDTGDNEATTASRSIYRVLEPRARAGGARDTLSASRLTYRYPDAPHDVEAMYVAPDATIYLVTKRPLLDSQGSLRRALVFRLPADVWSSPAAQIATLVDSLPVIPGSAVARLVTDASLSADARYLAVRTYTQVYVFATDPSTGRPIAGAAPSICNVASLGEKQGEGVTWLGTTRRLLFTSEGRSEPIRIAECPLPR